MPTKILYIVGSGSKNCDWELRWSLRSLEKHALDGVEPVIVGNVPEWFNGNAVQCDDRTNRKEMNIMAKILRAIDEKLVDGIFQISADDHFWMDTVDLEMLPIYYRQASLPDAYSQGENNYAKALVATRHMLEDNGYPFINTTVHCNQWVDARTALQVRQMIEDSNTISSYGLAAEYGLVSWAVWPNVAIANRICKPIAYREDIKVKDESYDQFRKMINGKSICSVNDKAFENPDVVRFFREMYSGKSKWEK